MLRLRLAALRYDRAVPRARALVDEVATELDTWPGVHIERERDGLMVVRYEQHELGVLDEERGVAELYFADPQRDALVEHGDAEPASPLRDGENVIHNVRGPSDITAVLELFDRRYRDLRGEGGPYSSSDPG
ncbi:MAG TPA: luciferase family protein [Solirubrobacteraceae bacterium]|nr:luciferase family protein [Solirubrobacteraceae bacterium]